jgi:hypothetical protein
MKNKIVRQYLLPSVAGIFTLDLPFATSPGEFTCLGIAVLQGKPMLLVREFADETRREARTFALVASGQNIPENELRWGCDYLGNFERSGCLLHLFGARTRPQGGKLI